MRADLQLEEEVLGESIREEFNTLLPNSSLFWVDKCGHAPMMEHPNDFNVIMENWLSENKL